MKVYYNDNEPYVVQWLKSLMKVGLIPSGLVDDRSIQDVQAKDLKEFTQAHFFAGIAGWSYALELAGWPEDEPAWTGSCPCQPFSQAGKRKGTKDKRHLWPVWRGLIKKCRPPVIFGEQVASSLGREWVAGVRSDLEALGYEVGIADLCAASVGAPQKGQRLWFVGFSKPSGFCGDVIAGAITGELENISQIALAAIDRLASTESGRQPRRGRTKRKNWKKAQDRGSNGFWDRFEIRVCTDGTLRRLEPGTQPLAHGVPARVGKVRAYGNAIVPQVAVTFIRAFMLVMGDKQ